MTLGARNYIRTYYDVPADYGRRIVYTYQGRREGVIVNFDDARLKVRLDGDKHAEPYHPTWEIEYLPEIDQGVARRAEQSNRAALQPHCHNCGAFTDRDWHEDQICRRGKGCRRQEAAA